MSKDGGVLHAQETPYTGAKRDKALQNRKKLLKMSGEPDLNLADDGHEHRGLLIFEKIEDWFSMYTCYRFLHEDLCENKTEYSNYIIWVFLLALTKTRGQYSKLGDTDTDKKLTKACNYLLSGSKDSSYWNIKKYHAYCSHIKLLIFKYPLVFNTNKYRSEDTANAYVEIAKICLDPNPPLTLRR